MQKSNKNGLLIFFLIVFIFMTLILGGYIVYDKIIRDDSSHDVALEEDEDKEENTVKSESLEVYDPLVLELLDKVVGRIDCDRSYKFLKDKKFSANSFSNEDIYNLVLENIFDELVEKRGNTYIYKDFSKKKLDTEVAKIVGGDYKFTHRTYDTCPTWEYDKASETYKAPTYSACGCTSGPYHDIMKVTKAVKDLKSVSIYTRVIFVDSNTGSAYKDFNKSLEITDLEKDNLYGESVIDDNSSINLSKGGLYKIDFALENDGYVFVSAEPIVD